MASKKENIEIPIQELNKMRKIDSSGNVTFSDNDFDFWRSVLIANLDLDGNIPLKIIENELTKAFFDKSQNTLDRKFIKDRLGKVVSTFKLKAEEPYTILTDVQLSPEFRFKRIKIIGNTIYFGMSSENSDYTKVGDLSGLNKIPKPSSNFRSVRVNVFAKSEEHAFEDGMKTINVFRALYNLLIAYNRVTIHDSVPELKPNCCVANGPFVFLKDKTGKISDTVHFYPDFRNDVQNIEITRTLARVERLPIFTRKALHTSKFSKVLPDILDRYITALDRRTYEDAYLRLWSLLEFITDTSSPGSNHETTVKRASGIYKNRERTEYLVNSLRKIRNRLVHESTSETISSVVTGHLKNIVEDHIIRLIHNPFNVSTLSEYGEVLQLASTSDLQKKVRLIRSVLNFKK